MPVATQLVVIYATRSKILRRKIIPDDDAQLALHKPGPGESRLLVPLTERYDDAACCAMIKAATGETPPSGRCCIVDGAGEVIGVCNADPELDAHAAGRLVAHDAAGVGDRCESGVFKRRYAVVDRASGRVSAVAYLPLDAPAAPPGSFLVRPGKYQVGDPVTQNAAAGTPA
jgi:hypothetical protein